MTKDDIFHGLLEIIGTIKPRLDISSVQLDSSLAKDLGIDSLSMLLVSLAIENKFGFRFKSTGPFETVRDVVDYIARSI